MRKRNKGKKMKEETALLIHLLIGLIIIGIGLSLINKILWLSIILSMWGSGIVMHNLSYRRRLEFENLNKKYCGEIDILIKKVKEL